MVNKQKICEKCLYFNGIKRARGFCLKNDHYTFTISSCNDFVSYNNKIGEKDNMTEKTKQTYIENLNAIENALNEGFKGLIIKIEEITNTQYFNVMSNYGEKNGIAVHVKINGSEAETFSQWFSLVKDARGLKQSNIWAFKQKYGNFPDKGLEVECRINEQGFYEIVY